MDAQHMGRTVVVGVDGSDSALRAVRWGAAEAGRRQVPLRLVFVFAWTDEIVIGPGSEAHYRDTLLERAHGLLAEAAEAAERQQPTIDVEQQLVVGFPIDVLSAEAERAHLMVVGDRGMSRVEGLLAGSVASALAAHAPCPVVVVRGAERDPSQLASMPVVVGVDLPSTSAAAIEFAMEAAAARSAAVVAVHAWSPKILLPGMATIMAEWNLLETEERRALSEEMAGWAEKFPAVPVEVIVSRDGPAHSLLATAARAQLIVVGSRGRGDFAGLVLGSVSNALVHRAPCPVAVVRGTGQGS
jgi:nucleotide-binding universal stress UspA family protein